jgi:hypothetical protein
MAAAWPLRSPTPIPKLDNPFSYKLVFKRID